MSMGAIFTHQVPDAYRLGWRIVIALLACTFANTSRLTGEASPHQCLDEKLHLREIWTLGIPDSFAVTGAALSPGGRAVWWSSETFLVQAADSGGRPRPAWRAPSAPMAAAMVRPPLIDVVYADPPRITRHANDGRVLASTPLVFAHSPFTASRAAEGWWIADLTGAGLVRLWIVRNSGERAGSNYRLTNLNYNQPGDVVLAPDGPDIIVAQTRYPFGGIFVSATNGATRSGFRVALAPLVESDTPTIQRYYRGRQIVPLDSGFIQTFLDLTSEERMFLLYDSSGAFIRAMRLAAPVTMLASIPGERILLAARRTTTLEIVRYTWTWCSP